MVCRDETRVPNSVFDTGIVSNTGIVTGHLINAK